MKMARLTAKTPKGYFSAHKKDELVQALGEYEHRSMIDADMLFASMKKRKLSLFTYFEVTRAIQEQLPEWDQHVDE